MKKFIKKHWLTILAVLYIVSPVDFIPEVIPTPVSFVDDGGVLLIEIANLIIKHRKKQLEENTDEDSE